MYGTAKSQISFSSTVTVGREKHSFYLDLLFENLFAMIFKSDFTCFLFLFSILSHFFKKIGVVLISLKKKQKNNKKKHYLLLILFFWPTVPVILTDAKVMAFEATVFSIFFQ